MVLTIYLARHGQDEDNAAGVLNGRRDQPLTELGIRQAHHLADQIVSGMKSPTTTTTTTANDGATTSTSDPIIPRFDAIYASPLQRAYRTAEIVAASINNKTDASSSSTTTTSTTTKLSVTKLDDIIERDFGIMTGTLISDIPERCQTNNYQVYKTSTVTYFLDPPHAETFPQVLSRAERVIQYLHQIHSCKKDNNNEDEDDDTSILLVTHGDFGKMFYAAYYKLFENWKDVLGQFHFGNSELILCSPRIIIQNNINNNINNGNQTTTTPATTTTTATSHEDTQVLFPHPDQTHVFRQQQHNA